MSATKQPPAETNGHVPDDPALRTYRGKTLDEILPRIRAELGPDAVVVRQRDGLMGGVGGFFQQQFVEVVARAGVQRLDLYDELPAAPAVVVAPPGADASAGGSRSGAAYPPLPGGGVVAPVAPEPAPVPEVLVPRTPAEILRAHSEQFARQLADAEQRAAEREAEPEPAPAASASAVREPALAEPEPAPAVREPAAASSVERYAPPVESSAPAPVAPAVPAVAPVSVAPAPAASTAPAAEATTAGDTSAKPPKPAARRAAARRPARKARRGAATAVTAEPVAAPPAEPAAVPPSGVAPKTTQALELDAALAATVGEPTAAPAPAREPRRTSPASAASPASPASPAAEPTVSAAAPAGAEPAPLAAATLAAAEPTASAATPAGAEPAPPAPAPATATATPSGAPEHATTTPPAVTPAEEPQHVAATPPAATPSGAPQHVAATQPATTPPATTPDVLGVLAATPSAPTPPPARPRPARRGVFGGRRAREPRRPAPVDAVAVATVTAGMVERGLSPAIVGGLLADATAHVLPFTPGGDLAVAARTALARRIAAPAVPGLGGRTIAFVGAAGSGKTRAVAGLAAAYAAGSALPVLCLALASPDGGAELSALLQPHGVAVEAVATSAAAAKRIAALREETLVVVDTPGFSPRDEGAIAALAEQLLPLGAHETQLVVPATLNAGAARELVQRVAPLHPTALTMSHADATDHVGAVVELACATGLPLAYVNDGLALPGALAPADPQLIAGRILG